MFKKFALACTLASALFTLGNAKSVNLGHLGHHIAQEATPTLMTRIIAGTQENVAALKTSLKDFYKEAKGVTKVALLDTKTYIAELATAAKNSRAGELVSPYATKTAECAAAAWTYVKESRLGSYTAQGVESIKALPTSYKIGLGIAASCLVGLGIYKLATCKKAEKEEKNN